MLTAPKSIFQLFGAYWISGLIWISPLNLPEIPKPLCRTPTFWSLMHVAKGSSIQDLRLLVPNTINSMVFETRNLKYRVLGPCEYGSIRATESRSRERRPAFRGAAERRALTGRMTALENYLRPLERFIAHIYT